MKINLPIIPRVRRAFTDEEKKEYYVDLFRHVFEKAASALLRRYQSQPQETANFLRCLLEDECMPSHSIKTVSKFYGDWSHADIARERQLLFARLRRQNRSISVAEISKELSQNFALVDMAPNFVSALKIYIVLPSSACEAERSFSTLCRLKTYMRSTQTQERLNNLAILNTHREHAEALDFAEAENEFVSRSQTRRNKFGLSS